MIKNILKVFAKIMMVMSVIFAILVVLHILDDRQSDYIEIYDDDEELFG